jgi:hypothetical protein
MILVREITVWDTDFQPNHTYVMNESMDKVFGYFKWNNPNDFKMFSKPMRFDTRYRKFKVLKRNMYFEGTRSPRIKFGKLKVAKDHVYTVEESENGMVCSCIGFKYHGKCKHIDGVIE